MKLIVNEVPLSKNVYVNLHWSKRKAYKEEIGWLIIAEVANRKRPKYAKARIAFNIYFETNRRRDVANFLGGGLISWLDVLVDQNIIADDSWDCIGQPIINFCLDKENPRTEIFIEGR